MIDHFLKIYFIMTIMEILMIVSIQSCGVEWKLFSWKGVAENTTIGEGVVVIKKILQSREVC